MTFTWFTPPTCITNIWNFVYLYGESQSPDDGRIHVLVFMNLHSYCYKIPGFDMPFWMYKVMWSINKLSNLIGYYKIQVINITLPGVLAQDTRLFFAMGCGSLRTRLSLCRNDQEKWLPLTINGLKSLLVYTYNVHVHVYLLIGYEFFSFILSYSVVWDSSLGHKTRSLIHN